MQCLAKHGSKVTFVNTEFTHKRVMNALSGKDNIEDHIHLVSIPDGLEPWEDRNEVGKLTESIFHVMPGKLEELIENINGSDKDKITCIVADELLGWALEVAEKMQIKRAAVWSTAAALLALGFRIPELLDDGIIDNNGTPTKNQMIQLSPTMPAISTTHFVWACIGDLATQKTFFEVHFWQAIDLEIQQATSGQKTQLAWNGLINSQPTQSSMLHLEASQFFDQIQFQELALGLELTNKPFLWVVRPDLTDDNNDAYPKGFKKSSNSWANGLSNGIPFLCWPYFADQFFNQSYICDVWKVGLGFNCDENGIVKQGEIKDKVQQLFNDKTFKARSLDLKEVVSKSAKEGGCSHSQ
ncbi:hypothetical protein TEA_008635 [Camellia sinensis var. sinensis]|uniref:Uncharacterized protein n=1 Tax=Camellia sinensis var. sinensis TaxID=542762 RepID=A0A4S4EAC3_CAMSN|nr:hypothetical protein TEA_008635 [Camellia sinensis var. sinensis]